jgi:hypothetical protein
MNYQVKLTGKRGKLQTLTSPKKMRIPAFVQERDFAKGTLRVVYDSKNDYWNEAEFTDYKSFLKVWREFTEKELVDAYTN